MATQVCFVEHQAAPERVDPLTGRLVALEGLTESCTPVPGKGDQVGDAVAGHLDVWIEGRGPGFGVVDDGVRGSQRSLGFGRELSPHLVVVCIGRNSQHAAAEQILENVGFDIECNKDHGGRVAKGEQGVLKLAGNPEK